VPAITCITTPLNEEPAFDKPKVESLDHDIAVQLGDNRPTDTRCHLPGCFHFEKAVLLLSKRKNVVVATLNYDGKTKSKTLNNVQLEAFKRCENELAEVEDGGGGCTTTNTYPFVSKTATLKKIDGGCSWRRFYLLGKALFGKLD